MDEVIKNKTDQIAATHLGKKSDGSQEYAPSLLVAVPRSENRKQYDIDLENLPFEGWDVWHAYEFSALTDSGIPVTRVLKLRYSCKNDYLMESKSLKLYLNSFNMTRFGSSIKECLTICKNLIQKDLSAKLQTNVEVNFLDENSQRANIYSRFQNIMNFVDESNIKIDKFKESPDLIETEMKDVKEYYLTFDSLRSNCRVTHQPDFGDAYIYYKSNRHIKEESLVKYLTSFRSEYHFHEECCEMIFQRLAKVLNFEDELFVSALYTRRGGIDICPSRWKNCRVADVEKLIDIGVFARCGMKQ